MNYLHSPSRHHRLTSKSPMSLFDSPSLSSHRYSDRYQALSCESPPPNFDHLQTPLHPQRGTLDWGSDITEKRTPLTATTPTDTHVPDVQNTTPRRPSVDWESGITEKRTPLTAGTPTDTTQFTDIQKSTPQRRSLDWESGILEKRTPPMATTPTTTHVADIQKTTPQRPSVKSPTSYVSRTTPVRTTMKSSPVAAYYKSPIERTKWSDISPNVSPVKKLDSTPVRYSMAFTTSLSSTPQKQRQQHHENTSPMNSSTISISSPLKLGTSAELLFKQSPLESVDDSHRNTRRPLEYIRSPVRNVTDNINNYIYDNTTSPLRSSNANSKKTPTPTKSTPVATMTPKPEDPLSFHESPKTRSPYQRRRSFGAVSPLVDNLYHGKVDDDGDEDVSGADDILRPVVTTTYRSPVYSNSSYKPSDKQSKTPTSQSSPITSTSIGTARYTRPMSPPSPIQPVRSQQDQPATLYTQQHQQQQQQSTEEDSHIGQTVSTYEQEQHDQKRHSPSTKQPTEDIISSVRQPSPEHRTASSSTTTATTSRQPQRQLVDHHYQQQHSHEQQQQQQQRTTPNVTPKSPVTHHRSYRADLPHYMRTTESYQSRLQAQSDNHHAKLHKTRLGGVTKRIHSPRIQPFRSTTKINALDDIKNEMAPEEVYVSLAERVKQFEKGLGNGGNPSSSTHYQHSSNVDNNAAFHGLTKAKSPHLLTRERSATSSYHRHDIDTPQPSSSTSSAHHRLLQETHQPQQQPQHQDRPRHLDELSNRSHIKRQRSTPTLNKVDDNNGETMIPKSKKKKQQHNSVHVKPFHFATDDRAARYQQTFRAKLDLWKEKDFKDKRQ
ncbi:hypothetical protein BCR42DRAFT_425690 [Absidia repens]|uniref:Uncharacterized protein n=1 Tax=Absidia repens TaxID=90262 RepID=A0A1X2I2J1_9FUNG|nr:hypothetical protein BCR42DRAFT_425690 [Absidia repens]